MHNHPSFMVPRCRTRERGVCIMQCGRRAEDLFAEGFLRSICILYPLDTTAAVDTTITLWCT